MSFTAHQAVSAVQQNDGYKPREERGWEEFHHDLNIDAKLPVFTAREVDGVPATQDASLEAEEGGVNGINRAVTPATGVNGILSRQNSVPGTPKSAKRRPGRPPRETSWASRVGLTNGSAPLVTPRIAPLQNQNAKEKLTLPQPSFRKVNTFAKFEAMAKPLGQSMAHVGYQDTDLWVRPDALIKQSDSYLEGDLDVPVKSSENTSGQTAGSIGRVEYDLDEQDDHWLKMYNAEHRKPAGLDDISHEFFEMTITKIEKEWHALEKRIPKPNPKPPQTHRPRSNSAAAVNGEPQAGEEQDSKCAICDDGDCENTNAIVFCDGCDLAVHQECYGVPFIPEGQWLCRKCQLIGRGIPTCIFCPNTDGGFKQTNSSRWAHLLCAMWIPEVSLGNHIFMEPVMDVEKVPRQRWKLVCYICSQEMGACVQCSNKSCFKAFHVTCARRARLHLKMKNEHGVLIELENSGPMHAYCDAHGPAEHNTANDVPQAIREAKNFYRQTMKGRIWADSQQAALAIAAAQPNQGSDIPAGERRPSGHRLSFSLGRKKKEEPMPKNMWKLPSGAPIIPAYVFDVIDKSLSRFNTLTKRRDWVAAACKYWTLKRESRRGAALLKRLQMPMEPFSSMEITRRNFAAMGQPGLEKLQKKREFVALLVEDMERLKVLSELAVKREEAKLKLAIEEKEAIDLTYFPVAKLLPAIVQKAIDMDKGKSFFSGLGQMKQLVDKRYYTVATEFATDLASVFKDGLTAVAATLPDELAPTEDYNNAQKSALIEIRERKKLAKRIIKALQPLLEGAIRAEADICQTSEEERGKMIGHMEAEMERCTDVDPEKVMGPRRKESEDLGLDIAGIEIPRVPPPPILPPGTVRRLPVRQPTPVVERAASPAKTARQPSPAEANMDIEMGDEDAEGEEIEEDDIFTPIPSTSRAATAISFDTAVKAEPTAQANGGVDRVAAPRADSQSAAILPPMTPPPLSNGTTQPTAPATDPNAFSSAGATQKPPLSAAGAFLKVGGLPWYLQEAQYDPRTERFANKTPTSEPVLQDLLMQSLIVALVSPNNPFKTHTSPARTLPRLSPSKPSAGASTRASPQKLRRSREEEKEKASLRKRKESPQQARLQSQARNTEIESSPPPEPPQLSTLEEDDEEDDTMRLDEPSQIQHHLEADLQQETDYTTAREQSQVIPEQDTEPELPWPSPTQAPSITERGGEENEPQPTSELSELPVSEAETVRLNLPQSDLPTHSYGTRSMRPEHQNLHRDMSVTPISDSRRTSHTETVNNNERVTDDFVEELRGGLERFERASSGPLSELSDVDEDSLVFSGVPGSGMPGRGSEDAEKPETVVPQKRKRSQRVSRRLMQG